MVGFQLDLPKNWSGGEYIFSDKFTYVTGGPDYIDLLSTYSKPLDATLTIYAYKYGGNDMIFPNIKMGYKSFDDLIDKMPDAGFQGSSHCAIESKRTKVINNIKIVETVQNCGIEKNTKLKSCMFGTINGAAFISFGTTLEKFDVYLPEVEKSISTLNVDNPIDPKDIDQRFNSASTSNAK